MDKSNDFNYFAGIDVSKNHLDIAVINKQAEVCMTHRFENSSKGWNACMKLFKTEKIDEKNTLYCLETTGSYSNPSVTFLKSKGYFVWKEMPIRINRSQGFVRGKSDKVDAKRIAVYALKNQIDAVDVVMPREELVVLKNLYAVRDKLVKTKNQYESQISENKFITSKSAQKTLKTISKKMIQYLKDEIAKVDKLIKEHIDADPELNRLYKIITSVDGVGFITAVIMLVYTNEFKSIDAPKKFACYAGIAPFENSSGLNISKANRVSHFANKDAKRVLHLAAMSAILINGEYKDFYKRKMEQGKPKMLIINIIRNKIVHRIFACVKQNRMYQREFAA
jgi:transposase